MSSTYRYKAFISYAHADEKWARWLHRALESYRPPKRLVGTTTPMGEVPPRLAPVFRDREELASSTDLGADLTAALEASAAQVVICSRASARSHWVNEEILAFKRLGRAGRIFSLIVDGEPYSSNSADTADEECFPPALRYHLDADGELSDRPAEPIAADARPGKDGKNHAKIKLLAGLLGVGFDDLRQRELQRRNRRLAIVSAASVAGMLLALGLATAAVIARNEADRQRLRAQQEAETARQTADFMIGLFQVSDPSEARGREVTAREILVKGSRRIDTELATQPVVQARLMSTMGEVFTGLGLYDDAAGFLSRALDKRRALDSPDAAELNDNLRGLADVKVRQAEYEAARDLYLEAITEAESRGAAGRRALMDNLAGLAELYFQTGQYADAEPLLRRVLKERRALLGDADPAVADAIEELGLNMFDQGRYEEAEALLREALDARRSLLGDAPHPDIAENLSNLGLVLRMLYRYEETGQLFRDALAMDRALYGEQHPAIAMDLNNLAELNLDEGNLAGAEALYQEALAMQSALLGAEHPEVARLLNNLAYVYYYQDDLATAESLLRSSIDTWRAAVGAEHPEVAGCMSTLGRWLADAGRDAEAEVLLRDALAQQEALLDANHEGTAITRMALADVLIRRGDGGDALAQAARAEAALLATLGDAHWLTAMASSIHGAALALEERDAEAEALLISGYERLAADPAAVPLAVEQARLRVLAYYEAAGDRDAMARYGAAASQ
jgi:Flp pilus assembly protein TadD